MKTQIHGGNVYRYQNCIDFSANCNPLGTPDGIKEAVCRSLDQIALYPQVGSDRLREAIAAYENCSVIHPEQIICGNGAAELIFSLCRAVKPKRALLLAPTFAEYEQALRSIGCAITYIELKKEDAFWVQEKILEAVQEEIDLMFFCNPNNPTGVLTERAFLMKLLERCANCGVRLAVDECFLDFVKEPESYSLKEQIETYPNLFLLKAFTKRYAMPGLRLGYGICADRALLDEMERMVQPWNVSSVAQAAGIAALRETDYVEQGRSLIFQERSYLCTELKKLGLTVYEPQANYIFFQGPQDLFEQCVQQGILIRDCSNYRGLERGYFRIAVKLPEENRRLIEVLNKILQG